MDLNELRLCSFCTGMVKWEPQRPRDMFPYRLSHHATFGILATSAQTCRLCHFIAALWRFSEEHLTRFGDKTNPARKGTRSAFRVAFKVIDDQHMASGVRWTMLEASFTNDKTIFRILHTFTLVTCKTQDFCATQPTWTNLDTNVGDKVASINSWLQECRSRHEGEHAGCRPVPFTPLRLVSVGIDANPPRLVLLDREQPVQYTTLSHCWGGDLPLQTTRATVAELTSRIPMETLPRTFADAIQMTRDLAIPYIWIDALCIMQDDHEEWESEAARMDSVYLGSQLNISAVQSSNSSQGCFRSDDSGLRQGEMLFRTWSDGDGQADLLVRVYDGDVRTRATSDTALSTRGWTMQEHLLSKRGVSCMRPEVHWNCQRYYATECGLRFSPVDMARYGLPLQLPSAPDKWLSAASHGIPGHRQWTAIVENYSGRSLTFPLDRIAAMAGIARHMMAQLGDELILGLWKRSFAQELGWMRIWRDVDPAFASLADSLPSWTWLACRGQLVYDFWGWETAGRNQKLQCHVNLLDWEVRWKGTPYVSAVVSAQLRIQGIMCNILIRPCVVGGASNPPYFQVFDEDFPSSNGQTPQWRCKGQFDKEAPTSPAVYPCLLLRSQTKEANSRQYMSDEEFLILAPACSLDDSKYRRIGLARITGQSPSFDTSKISTIILV